jgi:uncharacterized protein
MNEMSPAQFRDHSLVEFDTTKLLANAQRQADERRYEEFLIVDVDCHHYETESYAEIIEYIEDPVLRHASRHAKGANIRTGGAGPGGSYQEMWGRITRYSGRYREKTPAIPHRDITLTKRWMDALGIDLACLFPTPMLNLALHPQIEVEIQMARAYNRWLCETILSQENRIKSMLYLPMNDPDAALKTVEEFGDKKGVIGFMVTSTRYKPIYDNVYMKVYRALEERNLPLSFHAAYNWHDQMLSMANKFITVHALGFTFFNIIHMANWVMNGLPERFPKLKVIWIESGLAWIPFVMQRFDNEYMMRSNEAPALKKLPSDYMRDMFYTTQPMEMVNNREALQLTFKMTKAETQLLYSSDYPHWDMDLPSTVFDLPFIDKTAKKNILGQNALNLFNLEPDLAEFKLRRQAERKRDELKTSI